MALAWLASTRTVAAAAAAAAGNDGCVLVAAG